MNVRRFHVDERGLRPIGTSHHHYRPTPLPRTRRRSARQHLQRPIHRQQTRTPSTGPPGFVCRKRGVEVKGLIEHAQVAPKSYDGQRWRTVHDANQTRHELESLRCVLAPLSGSHRLTNDDDVFELDMFYAE